MPRPRKPVEQKKLAGTYRPNKHGPLTDEQAENVDRAIDGTLPPPKKPSGLSRVASKFWDAVIATGTRIWPSHVWLLKRYCDLQDKYEQLNATANETLKESGKLPVSDLTAIGIVSDKLLQIEKELCITPRTQALLPVVKETGPKKSQVKTRPKDVDEGMKRRK